MRIIAIALMCGAMVCFTGLGHVVQMARAANTDGADRLCALCGGGAHRACGRETLVATFVLRSSRPGLQALRSLLLFGSTAAVVLALRQLQLAETATISFLTPIFVALLAGPLLSERVGSARMIAIAVGFLGVLIATRPGTSAFQPIVLVAVAGVACNSGYVLATRKLAGLDSAATTLLWTQAAGVVLSAADAAVGLDMA